MKVMDIMTKEIVTINKDEPVRSALTLMREHDIHHLPVTNKQKLVGMVSDKDIYKVLPDILEITSHADLTKLLDTIKIERIMTCPVKVVTPEMDTQKIANFLLKYKFHCFPVVSHGTLVGMVTATDLLHYIAE